MNDYIISCQATPADIHLASFSKLVGIFNQKAMGTHTKHLLQLKDLKPRGRTSSIQWLVRLHWVPILFEFY